jgi:acyl-coenzyme A thioesterase PaaI-like protein
MFFLFYRHVHGGAIATILDSVMGICAIYSGYKSQTANLTVDYKR